APLASTRRAPFRGPSVMLIALLTGAAARVAPYLNPAERAIRARLAWAGDAIVAGSFAARVLAASSAGFALVLVITTPLTAAEQAWFTAATLTMAWLIRGFSGSLPSLLLVSLSLLATLRYCYWRLTTTLIFESPAGWAFGLLLLFAEAYTWLILLQGFVQTVMPLRRPPVALPEDPRQWPSVDVLIPTYNEPLRIVRATVLAALNLDWPAAHLRVFLLDDGRREEFQTFAASAGVGYITRGDNAHAKAGNLNHALTLTHGEFVAIFDCDHIPTRSFLQVTMGWMVRDPRCALIQTPHHFFSADPFERNLGIFGRVPGESALFHRLIQDGNDLWNASFFAGSCAVLRRRPLEEIGGVAVQTVTEDAHTALRLHRRGYRSAYINIPQAAGLATESLAAHIAQRIRWARGMVQIFRTDNPLLGGGLSFFQRLCYANAMLHFFHGLPRLIFLTAPLSYLFFEVHIIHAQAITLASYVIPYLAHATIANGKMQGAVRHSVWAGVYESVLSWYITLPTLLALINPKLGTFNVTPKGAMRQQAAFDWGIAKPLLVILTLNALGLALGFVRLFWWNAYESDVVLLNLFWTVLNLVVLGTAVGAAREARQTRTTHRVSIRIPATLCLADGRSLYCRLGDYSFGGLRIEVDRPEEFTKDQRLFVALRRADLEVNFPARVKSIRGHHLGLQFEGLSLEEEAQLVQCTFARADAWQDEPHDHAGERPSKGLLEVLSLSGSGMAAVGSNLIASLRTWRAAHRPPVPARVAEAPH
ncbi:MAG: UDP-forming cellulose synthase catalytic subunit, partial [Gammaproteobacteria bacterium]|nr:UDP-forming cellulose synthase catalytic subunit [Gammaproteobacteria bacterium]